MPYVIEKIVEIDAPAALVWEVITDVQRYPEWNPFTVKVETSFKPGEAIDMQVKLMAKPQFQREWVTEFVPGQRFAYRMKPVPLNTLSSYRSHDVEAIGPGRTRYRSFFTLKGWLHPVVVGLLGGKLQAGFAGMTEGIRQRAEALARQRKAA